MLRFRTLLVMWVRALSLVLVWGLFARAAGAQPLFSIDFQGPPMGAFSPFFPGAPLTEGDLLFPGIAAMLPAPGPLPPPGAVILAGPNPPGVANLGLPPYAFGMPSPAGVPNFVEVDAISNGFDCEPTPGPGPFGDAGCVFTYSVDEFAAGFPGPPPAVPCCPPNISTEGVFGTAEAAADVYMKMPPAKPPFPGPYGPGATPPDNTLLFDGDGVFGPGPAFPPIVPIGLVGLGIPEPDPPTPMAGPDPGGNLDALDLEIGPAFPMYFSLDAAFPDPLEFGPTNTGSAAAIGFMPGDVLVSPGGAGFPVLYAPAGALGLDVIGPPGSDDLDALTISENGIAGYQPSMGPYDWLPAAGSDMLLFSVRRGSALIGVPDSCMGIPIEEGDILTTPLAGAVPPVPCIFMAAENLGLATARSFPAYLPFPPNGDDLDAVDLSQNCNADLMPDFYEIAYGFSPDCNGNGRPDMCDIAGGASDCNGNGIPDACEPDCNGNGSPDDCDILSGASKDCNANGIPDECDGLVCSYVDCQPAGGDCVVDIDDYTGVILNWGLGGKCDFFPFGAPDGIVNIDEFTQVILNWGSCP